MVPRITKMTGFNGNESLVADTEWRIKQLSDTGSGYNSHGPWQPDNHSSREPNMAETAGVHFRYMNIPGRLTPFLREFVECGVERIP